MKTASSFDKQTLHWVDSVLAEVNNRGDVSRRTLLKGAGAASALAMLAACGTDEKQANATADVVLLNALLTAEYGAIKAYTAGAGLLGASTLPDSPFKSAAPVILEIAKHWQQQHKDHASVLVDTIKAAKGTPVDESKVGFTAPQGLVDKPTVENVMRLACNAERAAAIAYNGVVEQLKLADNRYLAASIEGDESQHFVVLYVLLKGHVAPTAALTTSAATSVVPVSFLSKTANFNGLESVSDLNARG